MIDAQGRIFGKWNILDVIVVLFLFSLTPIFYVGYKIFTKPPPILEHLGEYKIMVTCPNCKQDFEVWLEQGTKFSQELETTCPICKNKVVVNRRAPTPNLDEQLSYQEQYYKYLLEKEKW